MSDEEEIKNQINSTYGKLGYEIIFISALENQGMGELKNKLKDKVSVLCGLSGVGKTTILNILYPQLELRTGEVNKKTQRGTHTTRHCEMLHVNLSEDEYCQVIDTPGFSHLKFDFLEPEKVSDLFVEIKPLKKRCKYKDCLHSIEDGCFVLKNLDKISQSRYDSYLKFVEEAKEYKKESQTRSLKVEVKSKALNNDVKTKIGTRQRESTRRKIKQSLENIKGLREE